MIDASAESDWDFYFCNVDGVVSSILVNLGAVHCLPTDKHWLLWVWVHMRFARDDGLSSDTEAPMLYEIEDALRRTLSESGTEMVGRITGDGRREMYFYSHSSEGLDTATDRLRQAFPDYLLETGKQHDPDWRQYRDVLYPGDADMQRIQNRRLVDVLEHRGDDHSIARPVDHGLYFRSPADRRSFANAAVNAGFTVHGESDYDSDGSDRPYFLSLVGANPTSLEHMDGVVVQLLALAQTYDARGNVRRSK